MTKAPFLFAIALGMAPFLGRQPATPVASQPPLATSPLPSEVPQAAKTTPLDEYRIQLEALDPSRPEGYFELAELVADSAIDVDQAALARRLYVLSFELDRTRSGGRPGPLAASACIGLASISRLDRDRRWLLALAGALDPRYKPPAWLKAQQEAANAQTAYIAATALGALRSGDGLLARQLLDDPQAKALLNHYDRLLSETGQERLLGAIVSEANQWPCRECGNQRVVKRSNKPGDTKLCPICNGNPGPKLADREFLAQLRMESLLLSGIQRSWSAQVTADRGQPLRDPDASELAPTFGIDPSLCLFRQGGWQKPAAVTPPITAPKDQPPAPR